MLAKRRRSISAHDMEWIMRSQPPPRSAPEQLSGHAVEEAVLERRRRSVRFPDRGQVRESTTTPVFTVRARNGVAPPRVGLVYRFAVPSLVGAAGVLPASDRSALRGSPAGDPRCRAETRERRSGR